MNILIWLQAIGGVLIGIALILFLGTLFLDALREYQWKERASKREAIRKEIARQILDAAPWMFEVSQGATRVLQIVGKSLNEYGAIDANNIREKFRGMGTPGDQS